MVAAHQAEPVMHGLRQQDVLPPRAEDCFVSKTLEGGKEPS